MRYGSLMNCVMLKQCLQVQPQVGVTQGTRQQLILLYWDCVPKHCTWPAGPANNQLLWMKRYLSNAKPSKHCSIDCLWQLSKALKRDRGKRDVLQELESANESTRAHTALTPVWKSERQQRLWAWRQRVASSGERDGHDSFPRLGSFEQVVSVKQLSSSLRHIM